MYIFLQEKEYNSFDTIRFCKEFEEPNPSEIGSSLLREKLRTLIEFIRLDGDVNESQLTLTKMHVKVTEAKLKKCLISKLHGHAADAKDNNDELIEIMKQLVLSQANPYEAISESHFSKQDSEETRKESIQFYGLKSEHHCQILGPSDKHVKVVNAHIWPRSATNQLPIFGLAVSDIHNPRNVLRLHQCIERAFDRREVALVPGEGAHANQFFLKVFPGNLRTTKLKGTNITFDEIDGKTLDLPGDDNHLPFRRLLAHHVVLCHRYAREKAWLDGEDLSPVEVQAGALLEHCLDEQAQQRIQFLWKSRDS